MTEEGESRNTRGGGIAYAGAFEAIFAILIGTGLGYLADRWLDTTPILMLVGLAAGFGSFVLLMLRLGRKLAERAEDAGDPPHDE